MRLIRRYAEFIGFILHHGERFNEWRCPNRRCGFSVSEDYNYCPYCGQKLKFKLPETDPKMITLSYRRKENIHGESFRGYRK